MAFSKPSTLISAFTLLSLTACQGADIGGGGVTQPSNNFPTPPAPAYDAPDTPSIDETDPFNTAEFRVNYGLQAMNTQTIYAEGITGAGILVAIIDDGIDLGHPDLQQNISPLSLDIATGLYADVDVSSLNPHGTQLAGIIAAAKNDIGTQGVAYNAEILAIKALGEDYHTVHDVASGIDYAVANGARVINLSITYSSLPSSVKNSLDLAVEAGVLIVISAGNNLPSSSARASLDPISAYALLASANSQVLAVGAHDENNDLSYFSNRPGEDGKNVYLLAPGIDIITTTVGGGLHVLKPEADPQFFGIDLDASGTSFAAPHVAGAAALMFEMFPNLTAREVVELLLTGATDVGAKGVDAITGYGIINLENSIQPQGTQSIPLGYASLAHNIPMSQTAFLSSPAFGDAFLRTQAFEGAFFQDKYRRAYKFDLRSLTPMPDISIHLQDQIKAQKNNRTVEVMSGPNTSLQFNLREVNWWENGVGEASQIGNDTLSGRTVNASAFISRSSLTPSTSLEFRHGFNKEPLETFALDMEEAQDLNYGSTPFGFSDIQGNGKNIKAQQILTSNSAIAFSFSTNTKKNNFNSEAQTNASMSVSYRGALGDKVRFGIEFGQLAEGGGLIGSQSFGAFGGLKGAKTHFGKIAASYKIKGLSIFGIISKGVTTIKNGRVGLISEFSPLRSTSFKTGVTFKNLLHKDRHLTLSLSQPLRITSGHAKVDIGTTINARDRIGREVRQLSLTPGGQELDFSMTYQIDFKRFSLTSNILYRTNPGHIANSPSDTSLLLQLWSSF